MVLPGDILLRNSVWSHLRLGYFIAMFLFFCIFILVRYRKARVSALMSHYRRSKRIGTAQLFFLYLLPVALFFLEAWLFDKLGWADGWKW